MFKTPSNTQSNMPMLTLIFALCMLISGSTHASSQSHSYEDSVKYFMDNRVTPTSGIVILKGAARDFAQKIHLRAIVKSAKLFKNGYNADTMESYVQVLTKKAVTLKSKKALYFYESIIRPDNVSYLVFKDPNKEHIGFREISPKQRATLQQLISQEQES